MGSQVYGVRSIIEDLTIEETGLPDATIQALVREAITHDPLVSTWDVGATDDGGTVDSYYAHSRAERIAARVGGVSTLVNELTVRGSG